MKTGNRVLAFLLAAVMLITAPNVELLASEVGADKTSESITSEEKEAEVKSEETETELEETQKEEEQKQEQEVEAETQEQTASSSSEDTTKTQEQTTTSSSSKTEQIVNYVYVDEQEIHVSETQHIVVGLKDEQMKLASATLVYQSVLKQEKMFLNAATVLENTALFSKTYEAGSNADAYQLLGIVYREEGKDTEQSIDFAKEQIDASYTVTNQPAKKAAKTADAAMTAYTIDEKGEVAISDTIEAALEENPEITMQANARKRARAGDLKVALSAGHDATHTGASANGLREEKLTLQVAKSLKKELETYEGVTVYMARAGEACPHPGTTKGQDNEKRIKSAVASGADVYLDLHFNSGGGLGAEIYYPNANYNKNDAHGKGKDLANQILKQITALGLTNRGAKIKDTTLLYPIDPESVYPDGSKSDYYTTNILCKENGIPGLIVEHAFLDNASDASKLKDSAFIDKLGVADATGVAQKYGLKKKNTDPSISSVTIGNKNDFTGKFSVKVSGVTPESKVKTVDVAVWSSTGGQDDIKWYTATKKGNGLYQVDVDIKNHKNSVGEYNAHVYITDTAGKRGNLLGSTKAVMSKSSAALTVAKTTTVGDQYQAAIKFTNPPTNMSNVKVAVWSSQNGQDDLRWYNASKDASGTWKANIPIKNHKTYGTYYVHAYVTMSDGYEIFLGDKTFSVSEPTVQSVTVQNYNASAGTFDVIVSGLNVPFGISKVEVPVWCADNQSDIRWYNAVKQSNGTYKVSVNIANHKYASGLYKIHTYVTDGLGIRKGVHAQTFAVQNIKTTVTAEDKAKTETNIALKASNIGTIGTIKSVNFAVWSLNGGQDDLVWYTGKKDAAGAWNATAQINRHKTSGEYAVHVYAVLSNGTQKFIDATSFTITKPSASVSILNKNSNEGTFEVKVTGIKSPSGVTKVQVPIWCATNQSDIKWYDAVKQSDGSYKVVANVANHKYASGEYKIHTYVTTGNGMLAGVHATTTTMQLPKVSITATDKDKTETNIALRASNAGMTGAVKGVNFAVWSLNDGQDDLVWYTGKKDSSGAWNATAQISRHKTSGAYAVHVYATTSTGAQQFIGSTSFTITKPSATVSILNKNIKAGTFDVKVTGIKSPSGVTKVQVPVWCANNQSDIKWYNALKQSDGSYKVTVSMANHKDAVGTYKIHTYVTTGNGMLSAVNATTTTMELPKIEVTAVDKDKTERTIDVKASNVEIIGNVKNVQFAVWSLNNGQDDLVWYAGSKDSMGAWNASVPISKHKTTGEYAVHVYATMSNGTQKFIGSTSFSITKPSAKTVAVKSYDSMTGEFDIVAGGITSPSKVTKIEIEVWCAANKSDKMIYQAVKQSDGTYQARVNPTNHQNHVGTYQVEVFVVTENGLRTSVGTKTQQVVISERYDIMGASTVTVEQMVKYYENSGNTYPSEALAKGGAKDIETFCRIILEEASLEGVRAEVVLTQSMKETGWLKFGGVVKIEQFNFAGLGATDVNGAANSATFVDVRTGIRAQVQHLKAYASNEPLKNVCVDPRFHLVKRGVAPYVQWLGQKENPSGAGWATSLNYGIDIAAMIKMLKEL